MSYQKVGSHINFNVPVAYRVCKEEQEVSSNITIESDVVFLKKIISNIISNRSI